MKIRRVKWKQHPVLGDLELDFINSVTGEPFESILFAGENGTGKTTILETISTFLNLGSFEYFEYLEYLVDGKVFIATPLETKAHIGFFNLIDESGTTREIRSNGNNNRASITDDVSDIRSHGCVFSKARANYRTEPIRHTTTEKLDIGKYDTDDSDNFTSLKQLVVDIQNQDNEEYAQQNKGLGSAPKPWADYYSGSRIYRFKNAFDSFFQNITYEKVTDNGQEKSIIFSKNGKAISIDQLSTGEKQIVFRGIYLLKNSSNLEGAAVMIDEPELSMHPKWQKNILNYYKQLFIKAGAQSAQMFLATHSEYVLEDALADKLANLVIVLTESAPGIQAKRIDAPSVLPSITSAETNYIAFDVVSNDYHIELYGYLQHKTGTNVKLCDNHIVAQPQYVVANHYRLSHNPHTGTAYETLSTYIRNAIDHPDSGNTFTETELRTSIELLIELCR